MAFGRQFITSTGLGGGGGVLVARAGSTPIANATQTVNVVFSTAMANINYSISASIVNSVDPDPQYLTIVSYSKTTNGFTAELNAPTDSANYILDFGVFEYV